MKNIPKIIELLDKGKIITKVSPEGIITYANDSFCMASGFSKNELIGSTHKIMSHPDNTNDFFKDLWNTVSRNKDIWKGKIKNRKKNGTDLILFSTIYPIIENDKIVEYYCVRYDITEDEMKNKNIIRNIRKNMMKEKVKSFKLEKENQDIKKNKSLETLEISNSALRERLSKEQQRTRETLLQIDLLERENKEKSEKIDELTTRLRVEKKKHDEQILKFKKDKEVIQSGLLQQQLLDKTKQLANISEKNRELEENISQRDRKILQLEGQVMQLNPKSRRRA